LRGKAVQDGTTTDSRPQRGFSPPLRWIGFGLLLLALLALYYYTCAPGIGMGDTALLVEQAYFATLGTHANLHNIAILIGHAFCWIPGENVAWKVNLASVFTGGLTVFLYGLLLLRVLRSRLVAIGCTAALAVSHSMWWHSTIAESYAVNALFTVCALWLLFATQSLPAWRLVSLFLIAGLVVFNHVQMGVLAVGATVALLIAMAALLFAPTAGGLDERPSWLRRIGRAVGLGALATLAFVVGLIPWVLVFMRDVDRTGWKATVFHLRGGQFRGLMFEGDPVEGTLDVLFLIFEQFPSPFLLAVIPGLVLLTRRYTARQFWGYLTVFGLNTAFFTMYDTWDRYAFLLPSFILLAFGGSLAVDALWQRLEKPSAGVEARRLFVARAVVVSALVLSVTVPPWLYSRVAAWAREPGFPIKRYDTSYQRNIVDYGTYRANPNKRHWRDVEEYAALLFEKLPRGAVYIDDDSRTYYCVRYFRQFYRKRPDLKVRLVNSWGFTGWGIDRATFQKELRDAYRYNRGLYLPALSHPFHELMPKSGTRMRFSIFQLDGTRKVYRLRTSRELQPPGSR
jgi:hypothetical protein